MSPCICYFWRSIKCKCIKTCAFFRDCNDFLSLCIPYEPQTPSIHTLLNVSSILCRRTVENSTSVCLSWRHALESSFSHQIRGLHSTSLPNRGADNPNWLDMEPCAKENDSSMSVTWVTCWCWSLIGQWTQSMDSYRPRHSPAPSETASNLWGMGWSGMRGAWTVETG